MKYTIQTHDEATYNHSRIVSKNRNIELNWSILIKKDNFIEVKTADLVIYDVWGIIKCCGPIKNGLQKWHNVFSYGV